MSEILSIGELLDLGNSASTAGLIPYSALEYNGSGAISGISGSAIAGGVDTTVVSSIASSYVGSGISGKVDKSAFDNCCSAMSSVVSSKLDASASSLFQPSGDYYSASNPSGFITGVDLSPYQEKSGMTAYQPAGEYYSASNPSGFITGVDLSDYAKASSLSSKLDASASSQFQPSGSYAYNSSLTGYIPFSSVSGASNKITAINGSAISGQGGISSATCSAIASAYAKSAVSSYVPYSALKHGPTNATISAINNSAVYDNSAHARINTLSTSRIPYSALEYSAGTNTITAISGSAIAGQSFTPSQMQLVVDSANMSAASVGNGIKIGVKVPVVIVSNSSQATAANVVYVVTG
jgi:hypothetical protein